MASTAEVGAMTPVRRGLDGIASPAQEPCPFRGSAAVLGAVTPGANWFMLRHRQAGARRWAINLAGFAVIVALCWTMIRVTQAYSPRPPLAVLGGALDPHVLQWWVMGFTPSFLVRQYGLSMASVAARARAAGEQI